LKLSFSNI